jgi:hypothetical protein
MPEARDDFLDIARSWERLSAEIERNQSLLECISELAAKAIS